MILFVVFTKDSTKGIDDFLNLHNMIVQRIIGENSIDSTNIPYISLPVRPLYMCKIEEGGSDLG